MEKALLKKLLIINGVKKIINIFNSKNIDLRFVGGCIRDALLNKKIKDIDFAINCHPNETVSLLKANKIHFNDYGKKYGSITAIIDNKKIELTSLREDINQQGRNTEVIFTNDWRKDSSRRDFTINSIYLSVSAEFFDLFNGYKDLLNKEVKFIGNIEKRIHEDFIRILRYYRFLGCFEEFNVVKEYEKILESNIKNIFIHINNQVIMNEIHKMLNNTFPKNSFRDFHNPLNENNLIREIRNYWQKEKYLLGINKCINEIEKHFN
tara:strand:- start:5 stop:799 length:795 start_codon:yes stop_codon:yes gene_type:complete